MSTLVTGGAGYIGSHVVKLLHERGDEVVVVDNLSTGFRERIAPATLLELDVATDGADEAMAAAMRSVGVDSAIHFAAHKQVGESVEKPAMYYRDNLGGLANVVSACEKAGVKKLVFSSSAATYGMPDVAEVTEDLDCRPINPYGETKLVGEWLVRAGGPAFGLRGVNLRYFNVAGAGWPELADSAVMNLVPIVLSMLDAGKRPVVFGNDYSTPDGTCIRDYVHVLDLAQAHLAALDYLDRDDRPHDTFNVGTGTGSSVLEVIAAIGREKGIEIDPEIVARRPGDPAQLIGGVDRIREELSWKSENDLTDIVADAVRTWKPRV